MEKKILITSALLYANGPLHFGHIAGAFLPADCYARFERMRGNKVLYVGGSDEYGVAVTFSAEKAGKAPKEHVDHFHEVNTKFLERFHISLDHFSRTTSPLHKEPTQEFFLDLHKNGFVEEINSEQLYSEKEKRFFADRYVVGRCPKCQYEEARGDECPACGSSYEATDLLEPRSKVSGASLIRKKTKHWFLRLDKMKEDLSSWLEKKTWRPNVKNFVRQYLMDLQPRAISRGGRWGIPLPGKYDEEGKVFYVWFDAPIGYISASKDWAESEGKPEAWKEFWLEEDVKYVQFIGKDNIFFHAIWFPAMVMGQSHPYKLVDDLVASEFYNLEGRQFSKTEGWYIDVEDFFLKYSSDQIRFVIAADSPESGDAEFSWKTFQKHCNAELVGKYGNLINRVLVFAQRYCNGVVPECSELKAEDQEFLDALDAESKKIEHFYETYQLRHVVKHIMEICQLGNAYFNAKKPWQAAKEPSSEHEMRTTIFLCLECIKRLALFSSPIMPDTASKVWKMLAYEGAIESENLSEVLLSKLPAGRALGKPEVLFQKVEDDQVQSEIDHLLTMSTQAFLAKQKKQVSLFKDHVTFQDFEKLDIRIGKVLSAERIPKSKKLLHLHVDLGFETRSIVSGIYPSYKADMLVGKKVVVLANLESATFLGRKSEGMILSAETPTGLELLSLEHADPGSKVS